MIWWNLIYSSFRSFLLFFFLLFKLLFVGFFFSKSNLVSSVYIISLINPKERITTNMICHKSKPNNQNLPHEGMSLEDPSKTSPEISACWTIIKTPCNLGFSSWINIVIPNTDLTVWEYEIVGYHLGVYSLMLL